MLPRKGVALVTGAARGIGRNIALRLAQDGFDVSVNDLPGTEEALGVREEIQNLGRKSYAAFGNVSVEKDVEGMVSGTVKELGSLDVMVANAGVVLVDRVTDVKVEDFDRLMAINVRGIMLCYKHAAKQMIAQGKGGRIIGASSLAGKKGFDFLYSYSATKFAVRGLTQSAAAELGKHGITVNAYSPGLIETGMITTMDNTLTPQIGSGTLVKALETASAVGRLGKTQDIAGLVSYLASPEASFITGQSVCIDGGVHFD